MKEINYKLHLGEAGSGKSYTIVTNMIQHAKTSTYNVIVVVPTHSAKMNLVKMLLTHKETENHQLIYSLIESIQVKYLQTQHRDEIGLLILDEVGLMSSNELHDILDQLKKQRIDLTVEMFGDANQLSPDDSVSVMQSIIEYNKMPDNWHIWANKTPYWMPEWDNLLLPPVFADREEAVNIEVIKHLVNYRFNKNLVNYKGYSDENFINDLISSAYEVDEYDLMNGEDQGYDVTDARYGGYVSKLIIDKNVPVAVPTNSLVKEINESVKNYAELKGIKYEDVSMFVHFDSDKPSILYLNPNHKDIDELKKQYAFQVANISSGKFEYRNAMTVHSLQGQTFESVAYYLGYHSIPKQGRARNFFNYSQFYTAISRAKKHFYLIGGRKAFQEMTTIFAKPVHIKKTDIATSRAVTLSIIEDLKNKKLPNLKYTPESIYQEFTQRFNEVDKPVNAKIFTQNEFINYFKNYTIDTRGGFYQDYSYLVTEQLKGTKTGNRKGNGKVQKWLLTLNDEQLQQLKLEISDKKIKTQTFQEAHGHTKRTVRNAINNM